MSVAGAIRYNSTSATLEIHNGTAWNALNSLGMAARAPSSTDRVSTIPGSLAEGQIVLGSFGRSEDEFGTPIWCRLLYGTAAGIRYMYWETPTHVANMKPSGSIRAVSPVTQYIQIEYNGTWSNQFRGYP